MRRYLIAISALLTLLSSCGGNKTKNTDDVVADSLEVRDTMATDSLTAEISEMPMPKAADELFDDFVFNFAANKRLQMERIKFPLPNINGEKKEMITKDKWKMEHFFMRQGYYTLLFGDDDQMAHMKDTAVNEAVVEKIMLQKNEVKDYYFQRIRGAWMMREVRMNPLETNANASFLAFYKQFVSDSAFQVRSINETVEFIGPDPDDDFNMMEGVITPDTWEAFAPQLPEKVLYNIIYGKQVPEGNQKIFLMRGVANGLELELRFKKVGGRWMLTKMTT